ncbi:MAG: AMP-binding protein [Nitrososphaeria archaeon]
MRFARTFLEIFEAAASEVPSKVALRHPRGEVTYEELLRRSRAAGAWMRSRGISRGDTVATLSENRAELVYAWFGSFMIGAVFAPINFMLKGDLLEYELRDSGAKLLLYSDEVAGEALRAASAVGVDAVPIAHLEEVRGELERREDVGPGDPAAIIYTSGTTGMPKGVVLPHGAYAAHAVESAQIVEAGEGDTIYGAVPLFHTSGQFMVVMPAIYARGTAAIDPWFHASTFWRRCIDYGATISFLIGTMAAALLRRPPSPEERSHRCHVIYTGGISEADWPEFERRFGVRIYEGYGLTESGAIAIFNRPGMVKVGTIGRPLDDFEAAVVDELDGPLPPGAVGEIVLRPREPFVMMLEYRGKPEETVRAWRNLWFHTGDLAYVDEEGFFHLVGRKKEVIRRRGENISPYYVESVIGGYPGVLEVAVAGVPDELGDEEVAAFLVVSDRSSFDLGDFVEYCGSRLPYYMVPRYVKLVDELPKTPTQKLIRSALRDMVDGAFDLERMGLRGKLRKKLGVRWRPSTRGSRVSSWWSSSPAS